MVAVQRVVVLDLEVALGQRVRGAHDGNEDDGADDEHDDHDEHQAVHAFDDLEVESRILELRKADRTTGRAVGTTARLLSRRGLHVLQ